MSVLYTYTPFAVGPHAGWNWGGGWFWLWGALWLLFWIALMGVVAWLAITVIRRQGGSGGAARAKDILAERFARGELSAEEYRQRLEQLD